MMTGTSRTGLAMRAAETVCRMWQWSICGCRPRRKDESRPDTIMATDVYFVVPWTFISYLVANTNFS
jgi:hypothetical protein